MSDLITIAAALLLLLYIGWQLINLRAWHKTTARPQHQRPTTNYSLPTIALLVPFRNEAPNLSSLSASLLAQDYPGQLEIIFIDDHSSDGGPRLLPPEVILLKLKDYLKGQRTVAHKKAALTYAIGATQADIIITTDADCSWPSDRVSRIAAEFGAGADVVLGPVLIDPANGFCNAFQALDLAAYQFLTAATAHQGRPALANGANFAFRRQLFETVGGYQGVDHLPSGDDVLLLHKFYQPKLWLAANQESRTENRESRIPSFSNASNDGTTHYPLPITCYSPNAGITTKPVTGWPALWNQRLRWAGKAGNYNNPKLSFAQALAFALSAAIVLSLITFPLHLRPRLIILLWGGKALVDLLCLWPVMMHFGQQKTMKWYPMAALVYPFFLFGIGTAALLGFTVKWKGRS
jgi:glycosyltransferase involved in cell wall biosynthesis